MVATTCLPSRTKFALRLLVPQQFGHGELRRAAKHVLKNYCEATKRITYYKKYY
jgi:hypothetical protein